MTYELGEKVVVHDDPSARTAGTKRNEERTSTAATAMTVDLVNMFFRLLLFSFIKFYITPRPKGILL